MKIRLPFKRKEKKIYYFGLHVSYKHLTGLIIDISTQEPIIINHSTIPLSNGFDSLLQDTDNLITNLETTSEVIIQKSIFFLPSSMLDPANRSILEPFNQGLKTISKELDLNPIGYIDVQEAIHQFLRGKGIANAVVIELESDSFEMYIYKDSNLALRKREEQDPSNVHTLISIFDTYQNTVPAKIYLYGVNAMSVCRSFNEVDLSKLTSESPQLEVIQDEQLQSLFVQSFFKEMISQNDETRDKKNLETSKQSQNMFGFKLNEDVYSQKKSSISKTKSIGSIQNSVNSIFKSLLSVRGIITSGKMTTKVAIAFSVLLLLTGSFFGYEYFFHTATVNLTIASESIENEIELVVPIQESPQKDVLGASEKRETQEVSNSIPTTGSREIGEKASGKVILHNFNDSSETFSDGLSLSHNSLSFLLDTQVTVASASSESEGVKTSGKKQASITADEIGPDYNLADGTKLLLEGYQSSLYYAIVDGGITGGTSETIQTVSSDDIAKLENSIEDDVKGSQTVSNIQPEKDEILLTELTQVTIKDSTFSAEVGEKAKELSIDATIETEYFTLNDSLLKMAIAKKIEKNIKDEKELDIDSIKYVIEGAERTDEEILLTMKMKGKVYKSPSDDQIIQDVTFKNSSGIEKSLRAFGIVSATINNPKPNIPFLSFFTPFFRKNITIEIQPE